MKRLYLIIILMTFTVLGFSKEYKVYGPQGGLAMEVTLPQDFNEDTDKCQMVILMHGIFSSKNIVPIPALAKALAKEGIASICFDFGGHWKGISMRLTFAATLSIYHLGEMTSAWYLFL